MLVISNSESYFTPAGTAGHAPGCTPSAGVWVAHSWATRTPPSEFLTPASRDVICAFPSAPMSTPQAAELDALFLFWKHTTINRYSVISALAMYIWDFCITIQDEVEYFWKSPWSLIKILYLLNRYFKIPSFVLAVYVVMHNGSEKTMCSVVGIAAAVTSALGLLIVQAILQVRLYALYRRSDLPCLVFIQWLTKCITNPDKFVSAVVGVLYGIQVAAVFVLIGFIMNHGIVNYPESQDVLPTFLQSCEVAPVPSYFYALGIPYIIFDLTIFVLAASRSLQDYLSLPAGIRSGKRLIGIMLRDSIIVFVITFLFNVANTLTWEYAPHDLYGVIIYWVPLVPTVVANRMLVNLKESHSSGALTVQTADDFGRRYKNPGGSSFTVETGGRH
ncbi:hypothetical protein BD779DRAFT_1628048 [Infundibulicybe gibba]|nr:hypothetical protein BD779DRAFT_1628048 [Infundibulicybe gibba]